MLKGFRDFVTRGNVIDLAVAVVIGTAFAALVTSLVEDLLTPVIGVFIGEPDFSDLTFTINGSEFLYGNFVNALITFLSVAAAIYFIVVVPINRRKGEREATTRDCPECTSAIAKAARRCPHCTAPVPAEA